VFENAPEILDAGPGTGPPRQTPKRSPEPACTESAEEPIYVFGPQAKLNRSNPAQLLRGRFRGIVDKRVQIALA